jgi:prepilin-type N-terminal cleavage/methylation domain-containing protein
MTKNRDGFTMIEIVVTLMIVGVLAAILTPLVGRYIDEARVTRAAQETQSIADAILNFNKNTGKWPIFTSGVNITVASTTYQVLATPGSYPTCAVDCTAAGWQPDGSKIDQLSNALEYNKPGGGSNSYTTIGKFAWRGPYATNLGSDPWGNAYLVTAGGLAFGQSKAAFVLSAGPNGSIDTQFSQNIGSGSSAFVVGGDDVVARIR